ncbi:MAG: DUF3343 domain-containing protein [Lachnospiraceae bacterium]|nr:DUF3343 domain-containing protein [Lachnospiraceae bacterium]
MKDQASQIIITFYTTAEAMATKLACGKRGIPGALISAPRYLSPDCGIAWSSPAHAREELERAIREEKIETAGFHERG